MRWREDREKDMNPALLSEEIKYAHSHSWTNGITVASVLRAPLRDK